MLKTTKLLDKPISSKNDGSKSASNKNNNNKPASRWNNGNVKINRFDVGRNSIENTKKSRKLLKLEKSKSEKIFKSWYLTKSGKKLSKVGIQ